MTITTERGEVANLPNFSSFTVNKATKAGRSSSSTAKPMPLFPRQSARSTRVQRVVTEMVAAGWHREVKDIESDHWDTLQDMKALLLELEADEDKPAPKDLQPVVDALYSALESAKDHLEYCGYGRDSWEREYAGGLADEIEGAMELANPTPPPDPNAPMSYAEREEHHRLSNQKTEVCKCGKKFSVKGLKDHQRMRPDCDGPKAPPTLIQIASRIGIKVTSKVNNRHESKITIHGRGSRDRDCSRGSSMLSGCQAPI